MIAGKTITDDQLRYVLTHARARGLPDLASCAMRALDGDSLYNDDMRERCATVYNKLDAELREEREQLRCMTKKVRW